VPSRWSLLLDVPDPAAVRPEQLYGLVAGWFEAHLDDAGHHAPRKAWTLSPLRPLPGRPPRHVGVDVGLLDDTLAPVLLGGAEHLARVGGRLGGQAVACLPWDDGRLGLLDVAADWDELASAAPVGDRFGLSLLTPATFRSDQTHLPFPLPGLVLGHLRRQWTWWGQPVEHPDIADCEVRVEDYRLDCAHLTLRGHPVVASVGDVVFRVGTRDRDRRAGIGRWLAVLPYAGLGADTRMGLGQAEADLTGAGVAAHADPPAPACSPAVMAAAGPDRRLDAARLDQVSPRR
jgi:hypothetical protein